MADDPSIIPDGTFNFSGGQNAALDPDLILDTQYYIGVNVSAEEGTLKPRWPLIEEKLDFSNTGNYTRSTGFVVSWEEVFYSGKFQAFIPYSIGPDYYNIWVVSGYLFLISLETLAVSVLNPTDPVNVDADRVNWSNAGPYLVVFDWPNRPLILEGIEISRSDSSLNEVPVSVMGALNQNRLVIANAGIDWTAGDPAGSVAAPDAPITFNEVILPSTGFTGDVYQIPTANKNNDTITAMGFLQVLDKSTGIGSLFVSTNYATYSYPTYLPRQEWVDPTKSAVFGSLLLPIGIVGQRAHVNVNSDVIFRSPENEIFAFTVARNSQFKWSNTSISREVSNYLDDNDAELTFATTTAKHKNKIFITCKPYRVDVYSADGNLQRDIVNAGVVVIETNNMASLSNQSPPAWAGVWTGTGFLDMLENNKTLYVAGKYRNRNAMYRFDPMGTVDYIEGKDRLIQSVVVTKEYTNKDPTMNKTIHSADLGLTNIKGKLTASVEYRPATTSNFFKWRDDLVLEVPYQQCEGLPTFPNGLAAQGVRDLNIGGIDLNQCEGGVQSNYAFVYKGVQLRIKISAVDWRLKYVKLKGKIIPQNELISFCDSVVDPVPADCFNIWEIPDTGNC